ncbi:hypothetical protein IWX49DRAFT_84583 [Phyllosticta citricarpa]|uniref:Uncharacterized protein n=2 Tax=Phyllosticta TaxID=121621 RepID=A0ABR1MQ44_9PEZI
MKRRGSAEQHRHRHLATVLFAGVAYECSTCLSACLPPAPSCCRETPKPSSVMVERRQRRGGTGVQEPDHPRRQPPPSLLRLSLDLARPVFSPRHTILNTIISYLTLPLPLLRHQRDAVVFCKFVGGVQDVDVFRSAAQTLLRRRSKGILEASARCSMQYYVGVWSRRERGGKTVLFIWIQGLSQGAAIHSLLLPHFGSIRY